MPKHKTINLDNLHEASAGRPLMIDKLTKALCLLESVLCDPEGEVIMRGSNGDRGAVSEALSLLRETQAAQAAQPTQSPPDGITLEVARRHVRLIIRSSHLHGWAYNRAAWDVIETALGKAQAAQRRVTTMITEIDTLPEGVRDEIKSLAEHVQPGDASVAFHHIVRRIQSLTTRVQALRSLCSATYQAAGAYDMPARFLDALCDAAQGEIGKRQNADDLLPCGTPDFLHRAERAEARVQELEAEESRLHRVACEQLHRAERAEAELAAIKKSLSKPKLSSSR